jgi:glycosyltransferase involved in cell wall biosynthesis
MKISVVTVNYNNARGLERTIESVACQEGSDFEYIVVDGDSSDGSRAVIEARGKAITKAIIEKDSGPYEAMNKGAVLATGEYLLFLNSGDSLSRSDALSQAESRLGGKDIYYGNAVLSRRGEEWLQEYPDRVDMDYLLLHPLNHQNMFIKKSYLSGEGYYDERYRIVSDWGFMVRAFRGGSPAIEHIPLAFSKYRLDGLSSARENRERILREKRDFLEAMDPICGRTLYKYVELCDCDFYRVRARFENKAIFDRVLHVPLTLLRVFARMGL